MTITLPHGRAFALRAQALALCDAILCPEWGDRYYSYNSRWAPERSMASFRDGSGAEYFALITPSAIGITGSTPGGPQIPRPASGWGVGDPARDALAEFWSEPAFSMDRVSYLLVGDNTGWRQLAGTEADLRPLALLAGTPEDYCAWAGDYYDIPFDSAPASASASASVDSVRHIFAGHPLTTQIVQNLSPDRDPTTLADDLQEIGYGR